MKATFFLPVKDNDGSDLTALHRHVEQRALTAFGGWTRLPNVTGAWKMRDDTTAKDESAVYAVAFPGELLPELHRILSDFKAKTTQEALYLELDKTTDVQFV